MDKQPNSRSCFICGRENDFSLKMNFFNDPENNRVKSELVIPDHFNSYPGVAHGGIVAAILDETAGRAILLDGDMDNLFITTRLEMKYRRPTPTGQLIIASGWILRRDHNRAKVAGDIRLADGTVTASCEATVIRAPKKYLEQCNWQEEAKFWRVYDD